MLDSAFKEDFSLTYREPYFKIICHIKMTIILICLLITRDLFPFSSTSHKHNSIASKETPSLLPNMCNQNRGFMLCPPCSLVNTQRTTQVATTQLGDLFKRPLASTLHHNAGVHNMQNLGLGPHIACTYLHGGIRDARPTLSFGLATQQSALTRRPKIFRWKFSLGND